MPETTYTFTCLNPHFFDDAADAGWLSPKKLAQLKLSDQYDPNIHMEDGSIIGSRTEDLLEIAEVILQHVNALHPALKEIVDSELRLGNFIQGALMDYPDKDSISVTMEMPFKKTYQMRGVRYSCFDDAHSWFADYRTVETPRHLLIC